MKDKHFNPFVIGKYVSKEYFCDRVRETELLKHHIENGRNVTIMSERRMGKTGLISCKQSFHTWLTQNVSHLKTSLPH